MAGDTETGKPEIKEELRYIFEELYRRGDITKAELERCIRELGIQYD